LLPQDPQCGFVLPHQPGSHKSSEAIDLLIDQLDLNDGLFSVSMVHQQMAMSCVSDMVNVVNGYLCARTQCQVMTNKISLYARRISLYARRKSFNDRTHIFCGAGHKVKSALT
jgi:hypothetical protein